MNKIHFADCLRQYNSKAVHFHDSLYHHNCHHNCHHQHQDQQQGYNQEEHRHCPPASSPSQGGADTTWPQEEEQKDHHYNHSTHNNHQLGHDAHHAHHNQYSAQPLSPGRRTMNTPIMDTRESDQSSRPQLFLMTHNSNNNKKSKKQNNNDSIVSPSANKIGKKSRNKKLDQITKEVMMKYFKYTQSVAAKKLGVSVSTLKRRFYQLDMGKRWPYKRCPNGAEKVLEDESSIDSTCSEDEEESGVVEEEAVFEELEAVEKDDSHYSGSEDSYRDVSTSPSSPSSDEEREKSTRMRMPYHISPSGPISESLPIAGNLRSKPSINNEKAVTVLPSIKTLLTDISGVYDNNRLIHYPHAFGPHLYNQRVSFFPDRHRRYEACI